MPADENTNPKSRRHTMGTSSKSKPFLTVKEPKAATKKSRRQSIEAGIPKSRQLRRRTTLAEVPSQRNKRKPATPEPSHSPEKSPVKRAAIEEEDFVAAAIEEEEFINGVTDMLGDYAVTYRDNRLLKILGLPESRWVLPDAAQSVTTGTQTTAVVEPPVRQDKLPEEPLEFFDSLDEFKHALAAVTELAAERRVKPEREAVTKAAVMVDTGMQATASPVSSQVVHAFEIHLVRYIAKTSKEKGTIASQALLELHKNGQAACLSVLKDNATLLKNPRHTVRLWVMTAFLAIVGFVSLIVGAVLIPRQNTRGKRLLEQAESMLVTPAAQTGVAVTST